jgi:hypothetical protein
VSWKAPKSHALVEINQLGCSASGLETLFFLKKNCSLETLVLAEFTGVLSNQFVSLEWWCPGW